MQILQEQQGLMVDGSLMRLHVAQPKAGGQYPGVVFFSDIYQLGEPMLRLANRLAGYGYVVAAPEIFHRLERPGTVLEPGGVGRLRGNADARQHRLLPMTLMPVPCSIGSVSTPALMRSG